MLRVMLLLTLAVSPVTAGSLDRAEQLIEVGDYAAARRELEKRIDDPAVEGPALVMLTRVCNLTEKFDEGVRFGKRAIKALPSSSEAHHQYAQALRIKMSKGSKVKAMFAIGTYKKTLAKAIELDPDNIGPRQEQIGYLIYAPSIAGGDPDEARERIAELKKIDWVEGAVMEAQLEQHQDKSEAAIRIYQAIAEKDPSRTGLRIQLGLLLQQAERFRAADEVFAGLLGCDEPRHALSALYQRARSRILGSFEPDKAVAYLSEYIAAHDDGDRGMPSRSSAYWRMGNAYEQLADAAKAKQAYEEALRLDRENEQARKALAKLKG